MVRLAKFEELPKKGLRLLLKFSHAACCLGTSLECRSGVIGLKSYLGSGDSRNQLWLRASFAVIRSAGLYDKSRFNRSNPDSESTGDDPVKDAAGNFLRR